MPPKLKSTKEKRLAQQRLCHRRRNAEIKNDPELLAISKEKRKAKYQQDKKDKKVKSISEQSSRAQREQRKKWKENSKRYRQRKKAEKSLAGPSFEPILVEAVTDDQGVTGVSNAQGKDPLTCHDVKCPAVKAAVYKVRTAELKKRKRLIKIIMTYDKKYKTSRKQIQRLKEKLKTKPLENEMDDMPLIDVDGGLTKKAENILFGRIKDFYLDDANSVVCAGKKEFITKNQNRMQKRYLCQPLNELYKKFRSETKLKVSYSFFCKLRPFWVLFPKIVNRDTCQCSVHSNIDLLIGALNKASIITEKNYHQVLSKICCDSRNTDCLERSCALCKSNHLKYNAQENTEVTFYEWKKVTKEVTLKNKTKKNQILTEKTGRTVSSTEAIAKLEKDLPAFLTHTFKMVHQYQTTKNLKENLNIHEACIHVDFSENYSLKYATEVQSFHFGGSRQQVTLHTAVTYAHNFNTGQVTSSAMCTVSECLRHDAPAVWAHLLPLIEEVIKLNPLIDTIHILSDSPTSQYRNKFIFYVIGELCKDFPQINRVTWNYSEAGHGKGAPDGVGATLKRTADRMVLYGKDVATFDQFYDLISNAIENEQLNIIVKKVNEKDIELKDSLIPKNIKPFKGTFSVYQVLWDKSKAKTILRAMSCFECDEICEHGKHLGCFEKIPALKQKNALQKENIDPESNEPDVTPTKKQKRNEIKILSDIVLNKKTYHNVSANPSTSKGNGDF